MRVSAHSKCALVARAARAHVCVNVTPWESREEEEERGGSYAPAEVSHRTKGESPHFVRSAAQIAR